jgi:EmrB/QacA subfamily drug resistance transporter
MTVPEPHPHRWRAFALVGTAFFMTVLDATITNVALPTIGEELEFSPENLQWVVTAYAIMYGGFLLLGGRSADLLGRRRMFMVGVTVFTGASLVCGLSNSDTMLIVARAVQGLGAAITAPAALSIVTTLFPEGKERNAALGIWGALAGMGSAVGLLAGGLLTEYAGWEWIFFVNVPIGLAVLAITRALVPESRLAGARRRYDALGAVLITSALILLVYAISKAPEVGWGTARTIGLLVAAGVLLAAFLLRESRIEDPLMPLGIFRIRTVAGANSVGLLVGAAIFSLFVLSTLYLQQVLGWSPLKTGLVFLINAAASIAGAMLTEVLIPRIGPKNVMAIGMAFVGAGLLCFTQIDVDGGFWFPILPGLILSGLGVTLSFIPVSITALSGVAERESGLASGLIETNQSMGGAIGLAIATSIFATHVASKLENVSVPTSEQVGQALTEGFATAYWVAAFIAFAGVAAALILLRGVPIETRAAPEKRTATSPYAVNRNATATLTMAFLTGEEGAEDAQPRPD